ncbi:MAG TPA: heme-binding protein [Arenimonas sp.]|nr:heme-binding protein [Arenimonas sp.]
MMRRWRLIPPLLLCSVLCACGGSSNSPTPAPAPSCPPDCSTPPPSADPDARRLGIADVRRILRQAVYEAQLRDARGTIAVVDRVGNVLGVFRMSGAASSFVIDGGREVVGGLEKVAVLPDSFAAISKAITGAYLSSAGNAFSTRTASQIVQEHFNPGELDQPAGPLFGVQFSQLSCSDLMRRDGDAQLGPKRSPLGLAADPGGLPLYKQGVLVGGVGVIADGRYGLDRDILDFDNDLDEAIAVAASQGFTAPLDIRAERITADGRSLRFVDSEVLLGNPAQAPDLAVLPGTLLIVPGYADGLLHAGAVYGEAASGYRADRGEFADLGAVVLVNADDSLRYPPRAGSDGGLRIDEVRQILRSALSIGNRARAQIRRPLGSPAQVTVSVVDTRGEVLGLIRSADAPVFGTDVALQKARSALLFSSPDAADLLSALPPANYLVPMTPSPIADYVPALRQFLGDADALADGIAYSARAIGNLSRPYFPDGIRSALSGPLSKPFAQWSPFSTGLQLDLSYNRLVAAAGGDSSIGCTGIDRLRNGLQIFPGAVPIYRGQQLVGAIGVSGDGVDQDDMVAFLGLDQAGKALGGSIGNAPAAIRADTLVPAGGGTRLRYVQCPQAPFNDSTEQNVCAGL